LDSLEELSSFEELEDDVEWVIRFEDFL
jgi:hypothetical protein